MIIEERGINTLKADDMRKILGNHSDFLSEQAQIIQYLNQRGHRGLFLPKFHPELNPIERVWAQSKRYTKDTVKPPLSGLLRCRHLCLPGTCHEL